MNIQEFSVFSVAIKKGHSTEEKPATEAADLSLIPKKLKGVF
jgi:hypothetical protein